MKTPQIVSPEEWRAAREQLLVREKEVTRARDALAAERRRMPWMVVDTEYWFEGPAGRLSLADLFEGRCVIPPVFAAQNGSPPTFGRRLYLHFRVRAGDEDRTRIASLEGYVSQRCDRHKRCDSVVSGREQAATRGPGVTCDEQAYVAVRARPVDGLVRSAGGVPSEASWRVPPIGNRYF